MFWERFNELCTEHQTKPNPVAKELGISSGIITKWKNGSLPNSDTLLKIADYFNVSVDYLLGRTEDSNAANDKGKDKRAVKVLDEKNSDFDCGDFFNNKAVSKAYDRLSEREKLQVMMYILDIAEKSETPNGVVKIIEKASPDSTEEA